jgi:flagellar biosynthesis chaperone FliJ
MIHAAVDPFDGPEVATLLVAVVSAVAAIMTAVIANRSRQHSQVVRAQVENEHKNAKNPNLRDDIDDFRTVILEKVEHVARGVDRVHSKVADVKSEVEDVRGKVEFLEDGWRSNRTRIKNLEETDPRAQERMWGPPATRREKRERDAW